MKRTLNRPQKFIHDSISNLYFKRLNTQYKQIQTHTSFMFIVCLLLNIYKHLYGAPAWGKHLLGNINLIYCAVCTMYTPSVHNVKRR